MNQVVKRAECSADVDKLRHGVENSYYAKLLPPFRFSPKELPAGMLPTAWSKVPLWVVRGSLLRTKVRTCLNSGTRGGARRPRTCTKGLKGADLRGARRHEGKVPVSG